MKLNINSINIPPSVMALNASPAEKLLLSIFAANPDISLWRVHRSLSITPVGLKKLKARLRDKGLFMGYKVSDFKAQENVNKVAALDTRPLVVHAELLDILYLLASEKVLCAFYVAHPDATNEQVTTARWASAHPASRSLSGDCSTSRCSCPSPVVTRFVCPATCSSGTKRAAASCPKVRPRRPATW